MSALPALSKPTRCVLCGGLLSRPLGVMLLTSTPDGGSPPRPAAPVAGALETSFLGCLLLTRKTSRVGGALCARPRAACAPTSAAPSSAFLMPAVALPDRREGMSDISNAVCPRTDSVESFSGKLSSCPSVRISVSRKWTHHVARWTSVCTRLDISGRGRFLCTRCVTTPFALRTLPW